MDRFWDKLRDGIQKGVHVSKDVVELYSKIGKLKVEQFNFRRQIDEQYRSLGLRLRDIIADGNGATVAEDLAVKKFIETVEESEEAIERLDVQIQKLKEQSKKEHEEMNEDLSESDEKTEVK